MRRDAERCRTLREHIRMYARAHMHARGFRPLGKRFGTFCTFGTSGGNQVYWNGLAKISTTSPTWCSSGVSLAGDDHKYHTSMARADANQSNLGGSHGSLPPPNCPCPLREQSPTVRESYFVVRNLNGV